MRKLRYNKALRRFPAPATRLAAFTLAELVISIGILILLMSLAGQVFTLTVKSTGQATALTRINQTLRMMERNLREDLRQVQAGRSIMVIQGNPVNAYWTAAGKEADDNNDPADGYDHPLDPDREDVNGNLVKPRADVLMFVTARSGKSFVDSAVTSQLQLVTYGMAELGDYTFDPDASKPGDPAYKFDFQFGSDSSGVPSAPVIPLEGTPPYPDPTKLSPVAASQWHLYRRPTLLLPTPMQSLVDVGSPLADSAMPATGFDLNELVLGEKDTMVGVSLEQDVLRPDVFALNPNDLSRKAPWYLPSFLLNNISLTDGWLLIAPSRLDPSPPPQRADRMGHYFLPHCASFKVEWMLDPQSEFVGGRLDGINDAMWFDPGNERCDWPTPKSGPDPLCSAAFMIDRLGKRAKVETNAASKEFLLRQQANLRSLIEDPWDDGSLGNLLCDQAGYSLQDRFRGPNQSHQGGEPGCAWPPLSADGRANLAVFTATRPKLFFDPQMNQFEWDG